MTRQVSPSARWRYFARSGAGMVRHRLRAVHRRARGGEHPGGEVGAEDAPVGLEPEHLRGGHGHGVDLLAAGARRGPQPKAALPLGAAIFEEGLQRVEVRRLAKERRHVGGDGVDEMDHLGPRRGGPERLEVGLRRVDVEGPHAPGDARGDEGLLAVFDLDARLGVGEVAERGEGLGGELQRRGRRGHRGEDEGGRHGVRRSSELLQRRGVVVVEGEGVVGRREALEQLRGALRRDAGLHRAAGGADRRRWRRGR